MYTYAELLIVFNMINYKIPTIANPVLIIQNITGTKFSYHLQNKHYSWVMYKV